MLFVNIILRLRFEVFTAVTMKNGVFWDVTPCDSCKSRLSEELSASIIRVTRIGYLATTLAVISNRRTQRAYQLCSHSIVSQHFMEPEGLLPHHKNSPFVPILNQINPVQTTSSFLSKVHFNFIHTPTSCSS
jgi:hypothetical protein